MKRFLLFLMVFAFAPGLLSAGDKDKKKNILLITESKGFRHGCVTRKVVLAKGVTADMLPKVPGLSVNKSVDKKTEKVNYNTRFDGGRIDLNGITVKDGDKVLATLLPCVVEKTFMELSKKTGMFDVVCSQDSRSEISAENLKNFDAVFFYTTGSLPLSGTQKSDLLDFIKSGKGFAGSHCATDTFYDWKEYGEMIGGYFDGHPWHQKIRIIVEDQKHPATRHLGETFEITDEIYQFRTPYTRENLRILMRMDMKSVKEQGKRKDGDNALAWVRSYGKGRVFYTALGHRDEVWADPRFQDHVLGGLRFVFFLEDGETTPSAASAK